MDVCVVMVAGTAVGVVVYTGSETRSVMNTSNPHSKVWGLCTLKYKDQTSQTV